MPCDVGERAGVDVHLWLHGGSGGWGVRRGVGGGWWGDGWWVVELVGCWDMWNGLWLHGGGGWWAVGGGVGGMEGLVSIVGRSVGGVGAVERSAGCRPQRELQTCTQICT